MSNISQQFSKDPSQPIFISSQKTDINNPDSFKKWLNSHSGILQGQEFIQYNDYLVSWYKNKAQNVTDSKLQLKLTYLKLLKQLQLFFSDTEAENWYNQVNLSDEKELILAIPYFAKKLKDISLYYLELRKKIKESKLRYSEVGTSNNITSLVKNIILSNYAKKTNTNLNVPGQLQNNLPELSAVKKNLAIQIEELYDFQNYFDMVPTLPVSAYFDVNDTEFNKFLTTKNLLLTSTDWLYKTGNYPLSGSPEEEEQVLNLIKQAAEKYLGEDKYVISQIPYQTNQLEFFDIEIEQGHNFFFWPGTVYETKALSYPRYEPIPLTKLNLETLGTAGSSLEIADTIFVKTIRGIEGAWLKNTFVDYKKETMKSILDASTKTSFRFPFPGFGLSAEDLEWTGASLETDKRYEYLEEDVKKNIENIYWNNDLTLSACKPIPLNQTTLIYNKAFAHRNYDHADKIKIWSTTPTFDQTNDANSYYESWLYRFDKTDISVKSGNSSVIYWPYEQINPDLDFPTYYPENINDTCLPVPVSSIDFKFAIAGDALSSSDVIYKINNYKDSSENAIECCWLSGSQTKIPKEKLIYTNQTALQLMLESGNYTGFVWDGNDLTDANSVFIGYDHQPDCAYKNTNYVDYKMHSICTCSQVRTTPFGHPGNSYTDNKSLADFIIEDNSSPEDIYLSTWKDKYNTEFSSSSSFGWFKTFSNIGWGTGKWTSGNTNVKNNFYLRKGKKYIYYRANVKDTDVENLPNYIVKYFYNKPSKDSVWVNAKKDNENNWVISNEKSSMVLYPGDLLIYNRTPLLTYSLTGVNLEKVDIYENRGSIWSNVDYLSIEENINRTVIVSYPAGQQTTLSTNTKQYPKVPYINIIKTLNWSLTAPNREVYNFTGNQPSFIFTPNLTGIYTVAMTAISGNPTAINQNATNGTWSYKTSGVYVFTDIPQISCVSPFIEVKTLTAFNSQLPGYVINTPLAGWDYNKGIFNSVTKDANKGGKPFWGKTYINKDAYTGYGGINVLGNPLRVIDEHNILSQPEFSTAILNVGSKVQYDRKYQVKMDWIQPIDFEVFVNENKWCTLTFNSTADSNAKNLLYNHQQELIVLATSSVSNISITNIVDNQPVEIVYYAVNPFSMQISATPSISEAVYNSVSAQRSHEAVVPWANFTNVNYPTVAAVPITTNLYSNAQIGGYFTPPNLGASVYINENYETSLILSSDALKNYFNNTSKYHKTKGLTKTEIATPYSTKSENNTWVKESIITGSTPGTIKKNIFKKYQKFLPYQSSNDTNPQATTGLITPFSRQSPWGGKNDSEWTDTSNHPVLFTGELNISNWSDSQILKQNKLQLDNWVTDIYGNQYGLYKDIKNVKFKDRKNTLGEIWVRKNSQMVSPGYLALSGVFDTYKNTNFYKQLTEKGIKKIDMFFDTLMIETPGAIIFEKISYDYADDYIFSLTDNARYLSLAMPTSLNLNKELLDKDLNEFNFAQGGETWFFPKEKLVIISICGLEKENITPELYRLNLSNQVLEKIFPNKNDDILLLQSLSSENINSIQSPVLSYNSLKEEFLLNVSCQNSQNENLILEITIKNDSILYINDVTIYKPDNSLLALKNPPFILQQLSTAVNLTANLQFQCFAENGPVVFNETQTPNWIKLTQYGLFTGTPQATGVYTVPFAVTNSFGPTYYSLTVNVTS